MKPYAKAGLYYQEWSSERMMHTVSIEDLRDAPLQSLANLHMQPPALDIIRAILANMWASPDSHALLRKVDRSIYVLWAVLCGLMAAFIFWWLSQTTPMAYAIVATLFFVAHPACIFYATFLDATFLTTVLILWTYYLLWTIRQNPQKSMVAFTAAVLALFFTRSLFQWPSILVFALSLLLLRVPYKRVFIFLIICGGLTGLYLAKQYYKFCTLSTFGWRGLNLCRAIDASEYYDMGYYWRYIEGIKNTEEQERSLPSVLVRRHKLTGAPNFNHVSYLRLNQDIMNYCKERFRITPLKQLLISYLHNGWIYFKPSSQYITRHVIVDRIPWRDFYDRIFSFPVLPSLILFAGLTSLARAKRRDFITGFALALPGLYIFLASVLGEKGENMRLKFFLEPVLFIFIASQIYITSRQISQKLLTKQST